MLAKNNKMEVWKRRRGKGKKMALMEKEVRKPKEKDDTNKR
jgi:hypothetical protein